MKSLSSRFFLFVSLFFRDLSENFIQAIPRRAFRGATDLKNLCVKGHTHTHTHDQNATKSRIDDHPSIIFCLSNPENKETTQLAYLLDRPLLQQISSKSQKRFELWETHEERGQNPFISIRKRHDRSFPFKETFVSSAVIHRSSPAAARLCTSDAGIPVVTFKSLQRPSPLSSSEAPDAGRQPKGARTKGDPLDQALKNTQSAKIWRSCQKLLFHMLFVCFSFLVFYHFVSLFLVSPSCVAFIVWYTFYFLFLPSYSSF